MDGRLKLVLKDVVFRVVSSKVVEVPCEYADRLKRETGWAPVFRSPSRTGYCRVLVGASHVDDVVGMLGSRIAQLREVSIDKIYAVLIGFGCKNQSLYRTDTLILDTYVLRVG